MTEVRFRPHSIKQQDLILSNAPLTVVATGTQYGKSIAAALWMKRQLHTFTAKQDNFLIMAPTYKIMNQSALPYFLRVMEGLGEYAKADAEFKIHGGGTVYMRTGKEPDSIVGIPNVRAYWLDEAGLASLYFWENIQARAASKGARGLLTTSPYARNWLYKDIVKPKQQGKLAHIPFIQAASWENPYHTLSDPEKRRQMRETMDPRRFDMVFGGEWGQMAGLVFDSFDEDANQCEPFQIPQGTLIVGGIDWGFTEPFVHVVRAITPEGKHYQISEFYKSGMTPTQIFDLVIQKAKTFGIQRHWCGHEQPGMIEELNRRFAQEKIKCSAQKADFDITRGNGLHYELIQKRQYKIFRGSSPHTLDEYSVYHYPEAEDLGPDEDAKEQLPVGQNDHAMSANRFITIHEYRADLKHTPKTPGVGLTQQTQEQRLERLKRRPRQGHSENWSESDGSQGIEV